METNINSEGSLSSAADFERHKSCSSGMMSRQTAVCEAALVPLFLGKQRCNVTFVVDSSESMRDALGSVKRLLIQTLLMKASLRDSFFNIMMFSGKLTCWSHHMLPCAPDTVYMALSWIHSISCSPGRDLLAALSLALTDPVCHAIHLLCTDLPDQPEAVLAALPALAAGRPVNVFYLQDSGGQLDSKTQEYLQCLTQATRGSCCMIPVGLNGVLEKVVPLYEEQNQSVATSSPANCCCPSTSVLIPHNTSLPLLRSSLGHPCMLSGQTTGGQEFFPGCRVLARRQVDGLYYLGTVIQQVEGHGGVWIVQFDQPGGPGLGLASSQRQLVCSLDMVNHTRDYIFYQLVPGDTVLSPWEPELRRYGPGRVMAANEHRDGFRVDGVTNLKVLMWNRCVPLVPSSRVFPISALQHERIVRELTMQTSSSIRCSSWPCARSSSCTPQLFCTDCCCVSNDLPCSFPASCSSSFGKIDGFERGEQSIDLDLKDTDVRRDTRLPSSTSPSSSPPSSSPSENKSRAVKLRSKQQRPPWRYWRQTGPEPQHRQPGSSMPRRTQPMRFSFPSPQISASPNHSSVFQSLPGAKGRKANIKDVFGTTNFKPRPPVGLRPFSGPSATVYT